MREATCGFELREDVRVEVRDEDSHVLLCRAWVHVRFEPAEATLTLRNEKLVSDLDVVEQGGLPGGFTVMLCFAGEDGAGDVGGGMGGAAVEAVDEKAVFVAAGVDDGSEAIEATITAPAVAATEALAAATEATPKRADVVVATECVSASIAAALRGALEHDLERG